MGGIDYSLNEDGTFKKETVKFLQTQGIKSYFPLVHHNQMTPIPRLDWGEFFMGFALLAAQRSLDPDTKCGCAIVRNRKVLGIGYNGPGAGLDDSFIPLTRPEKYDYMAHSEGNAIVNAAQDLTGASAYITGRPCPACLVLLWNAGIKTLYICDYSKPKCVTDNVQIEQVYSAYLKAGLKIHNMFTPKLELFQKSKEADVKPQRAIKFKLGECVWDYKNQYCGRVYEKENFNGIVKVLQNDNSVWEYYAHDLHADNPVAISDFVDIRPIIVIASLHADPIPHEGHIAYLKAARAMGTRLIVILNNNHQCVLKKGFFAVDEKTRLELVRSLKWVDEAVLSVDQTRNVPLTLNSIGPFQILANGADATEGDPEEIAVAQKCGAKCIYGVGGYEKTNSSTKILEDYQSRYIAHSFDKRDEFEPKSNERLWEEFSYKGLIQFPRFLHPV